MFQELQDKAEDLSERAQQSFSTEPDGRNAGIGPTESMLAFGTALAATLVARNVLQLSWRRALDREPPKNPASSNVAWKEAILWGALSGALVGVTRIAARRGSTSLYRQIRR